MRQRGLQQWHGVPGVLAVMDTPANTHAALHSQSHGPCGSNPPAGHRGGERDLRQGANRRSCAVFCIWRQFFILLGSASRSLASDASRQARRQDNTGQTDTNEGRGSPPPWHLAPGEIGVRIDDAEDMLPARHHAVMATRRGSLPCRGDRGQGKSWHGRRSRKLCTTQTISPSLPHAAVPRAILDSPWVIVGEPNRSDARLLCGAGAAWPRASAD